MNTIQQVYDRTGSVSQAYKEYDRNMRLSVSKGWLTFVLVLIVLASFGVNLVGTFLGGLVLGLIVWVSAKNKALRDIKSLRVGGLNVFN